LKTTCRAGKVLPFHRTASMDHAPPTRAALADQPAIDELVRAFFRLFSPEPDGRVRLWAATQLFIPQAVITKACGPAFEVYDLPGFIAPRERLLNDGTITQFREWEIDARTTVVGHVAQRLSLYGKSWQAEGAVVRARGVKTFQFVKTSTGWRISALAWDDERDGLDLPATLGDAQTTIAG
jgi:hypothetical protein